MKSTVTFSLLLVAAFFQKSNAQSANQSLSNLTATSINRPLIPLAPDSLNLGSPARQWRGIYFKGSMFSNNIRVVGFSGDNIGLGRNALANIESGYSNTAVGDAAMKTNQSGYLNVAIGTGALYKNQSGWWNTAVGAECLSLNTTGTENTAMGQGALFANTRGRSNTAIGSDAMSYEATGAFNTSIGANSMGILTYGSGNTAIGEYTLHQSEASGNTALGDNAGSYYPNSDNNTFIGYNTYANDLYFTNSTALGYDTHITASNQVRVGNGGITSIGGVVGWSNLSDGRYKKNIRPNVPGIAFINALRPVTYTLDAKGLDAYYKKDRPQKTDAKGNVIEEASSAATDFSRQEAVVYSGFVAQDVETAAKKLNYAFSGVDAPKNAKDLYGLRYSEFVVPLVKAVQELSAKNDSLVSALGSLQAEVAGLKALVTSNAAAGQRVQTATAAAAGILLLQNSPNPARQTTQIGYTLPAGCSGAQLVVTNAEGKTLQQLSVSAGKGTLTLDVAALPAGTYTYTLFANGAAAGSRQLMIVK